jgi:hypothetical protein
MSWIDFIGYLAALTVLATFCMDTSNSDTAMLVALSISE